MQVAGKQHRLCRSFDWSSPNRASRWGFSGLLSLRLHSLHHIANTCNFAPYASTYARTKPQTVEPYPQLGLLFANKCCKHVRHRLVGKRHQPLVLDVPFLFRAGKDSGSPLPESRPDPRLLRTLLYGEYQRQAYNTQDSKLSIYVTPRSEENGKQYLMDFSL